MQEKNIELNRLKSEIRPKYPLKAFLVNSHLATLLSTMLCKSKKKKKGMKNIKSTIPQSSYHLF